MVNQNTAENTAFVSALAENAVKSRLRIASVIWCAVIAAAALALFLSRPEIAGEYWPVFVAALTPGLAGLILSPLANREWAQVSLLLVWLAFAIVAVMALAFLPMAILFLCVPAVASLFERERVLEALIWAALGAGLVYALQRYGGAPALSLSPDLASWGEVTAICGTISFMIAALFAISDNREDSAALLPDSLAAAAVPNEVISPNLKTSSAITDVLPGTQFVITETGDIAGESRLARAEYTNGKAALVDRLGLAKAERLALQEVLAEAKAKEEPQHIVLSVPGHASEKSAEQRSMAFDIYPQGENFYVALTDISGSVAEAEKLRAENQEHLDALENRNLFFAGVSHELRTPLNAIIGFSDMMRSRLFGPLPGKYSEYADLIHESGQHMLDLLGDVLDLSKIEAGKYELSYDQFDLEDVIRSSVKMVQPQADHRELALVIEIDDPAMSIQADRRAVRQILLNLLSNAIKFTPKGGRVVVSAGEVGAYYEIAISDNGAGMSEDELKRAMQPYQQTGSALSSEARGTGLGLSLVKSLTELHGGEFSLDSAPEEGTRATVTLPRRRSAA